MLPIHIENAEKAEALLPPGERLPEKLDRSVGAVVICHAQAQGERRVLVIRQLTSSKEVYWAFPKGHPEGDESDEVAAVREVREETLFEIPPSSLVPNAWRSQAYTFFHPKSGFIFHKRVDFTLARIFTDQLPELQANRGNTNGEVDVAVWLTPEDALACLKGEDSNTLRSLVQLDDELCAAQS